MRAENEQASTDRTITALARKPRPLSRVSLHVDVIVFATSVLAVPLFDLRQNSVVALWFDENKIRTKPFLSQFGRRLDSLSSTRLINSNAHPIVSFTEAFQQ